MKTTIYLMTCILQTIKLIAMQLFAATIVAFLIAMWIIPFGLAADNNNSYWLLLYIPVFIIAGILNNNEEKYHDSL